MEDPLYEKYESLDLQEAGEVLLSTVSKTSDANAQAKLVDQFREKLESSHLVGIDEDAVGDCSMVKRDILVCFRFVALCIHH